MKTLKKLLALIGAFCLLSSPTFAAGEREIGVFVDGKQVEVCDGSADPLVRDDRVYLPARRMAEDTGYEIHFDNKTKEVTLTSEQRQIVTMSIGKKDYVVDGEKKTMDVVPFIEKGSTYVPMRYVAEAFHKSVEWDETNRIAMFGELGLAIDPEGEVIQLSSTIRLTIPEELSDLYVYKEGASGKALYEKKNDEARPGSGWLGRFEISDTPRDLATGYPTYIVRREGDQYLLFVGSHDSRRDFENDALEEAYREARERLPEILSTVLIEK
ncbi:MAG: copper amine oxidase N-terminal domain-containing protein [Peptoniphilus sp.]|nr:copper amine oxidase N-terminal domain-containing protein [Peptoniphilus sp.]MDD7363769.1 copper amine oxidase N-terminal domain-containing protein [Bacillota bacterium]MDY6044610.1 copper amine oxidase N-terminal domain-containing protein [Peptoniphilus sp.]